MSTELKFLLTIEVPRPFYSRGDEDHFFSWLQSIPEVEKVTGVGETLEITVCRPMKKDSLQDFIALMTRYGLDRRPLKPLCDEQSGDYFRDEGTYWHSAVYG